MRKRPLVYISVRAPHANSRAVLSLPNETNYQFTPAQKVKRFWGEFEGVFSQNAPSF